MFPYSHYIDSKYSKPIEPAPTDDTAVQSLSAAITYGNILFNTYKTEELATQIMDTKLKAESLKKERDFYYNKLRDIEALLGVMQDGFDDPAIKRILTIVYETQEVCKVKKKVVKNKKKKKYGKYGEGLEHFPLVDYPAAPTGS